MLGYYLPIFLWCQDGRKLLHALKEAYMNTDFQAEVHRLRASHSADELRFLTTLGPLAAKVQAPVFEQFGLPPGQRGVILMKMGVRLLSMVAPDIKELAGDLREMLCLPREEEDISSTIKKAESDLTALLEYPVLRIIQTIKRHQKTIGNYMYCICGKACRKPIDAFLFNSLIATFGFPYNSKGLFFYMTLPDPQSQVTNSKDQPIHAHPIPSHPIFHHFPPGIPSIGAEDRFSALGRPWALGRSIPAAIQGQSHRDRAGHPWIAEASQRAGEASYGPSGLCFDTFLFFSHSKQICFSMFFPDLGWLNQSGTVWHSVI